MRDPVSFASTSKRFHSCSWITGPFRLALGAARFHDTVAALDPIRTMELFEMIRTIGIEAKSKIVVGVLALLIFVPAGLNAQSDMKMKYPRMAPIDEYLMNRDAEVALARSAAPPAISKDATVLVLTRKGWETAFKGTNGFVCMVDRAWASSIDFPEVWNPKTRGADCLNPAAARTILPIVHKLTQMQLAGDSEKQRIAGIQAAFAKKEIPPWNRAP